MHLLIKASDFDTAFAAPPIVCPNKDRIPSTRPSANSPGP